MSARKKNCFFSLFLIAFLFGKVFSTSAQKVGYVSVEKILALMPEFQNAKKEINTLTTKWEKELDEELAKIKSLQEALELEKVLLTDEQIELRQNEIELRHQRVLSVQSRRFAPNGHLSQLRKKLTEPVQSIIYESVYTIAKAKGFGMIFGREADLNIVYASEKLDITKLVLIDLGYNPEKKTFKNIKLKNALKQGVKSEFQKTKKAVTDDVKKVVSDSKESLHKSLDKVPSDASLPKKNKKK